MEGYKMSRCARCETTIPETDVIDDIALCNHCRIFDRSLDSVVDGLCVGGMVDDDLRAVDLHGSVKAVRFW